MKIASLSNPDTVLSVLKDYPNVKVQVSHLSEDLYLYCQKCGERQIHPLSLIITNEPGVYQNLVLAFVKAHKHEEPIMQYSDYTNFSDFSFPKLPVYAYSSEEEEEEEVTAIKIKEVESVPLVQEGGSRKIRF